MQAVDWVGIPGMELSGLELIVGQVLPMPAERVGDLEVSEGSPVAELRLYWEMARDRQTVKDLERVKDQEMVRGLEMEKVRRFP